MNDTDDDLRRATHGDRDALRRVLDTWWPRMRRWALLDSGDPNAAEDALQEAVVRVLRFVERFDAERPFGPWLRTIVRNACRDERARRGRSEETVEEDAHGADHPSPEHRIDLSRAASAAVAAFAGLSPRQREIVDLVDRQGLTPIEAAAALGLSAGAVRSQLFDARRALRSRLLGLAPAAPLLREA